MNKVIQITPCDDVAVALAPVSAGEALSVGGVSLVAVDAVPAGHKIALHAIAAGAPIIKYGYPIGAATRAIAAGAHVHAGLNIKTLLSPDAAYAYDASAAARAKTAAAELRKGYEGHVPAIQAFLRPDGRIGIRNELWIVPTVGCVNRVGERLVAWARQNLGVEVRLWSHPYGCSQLGDDHQATRTILADLVRHPNAGGVLVLSLGCENNTPASFRELVGPVDPARVKFLTCQDVPDEIAVGQQYLAALAAAMRADRRIPVPLSKLVVGFKCGGSDGLSGITANPLVGRFCDALTAMGGTAVLTEVPEMFGAEQVLMSRAESPAVFEQIVALINNFKDYFVRHGQVVYENPSPGNKAGGISTLEDKSLGCVQKGGQAVVTDVIPYGGRVSRPGLTLLSGPGNDIVSTTALAAAGCHLILFTTGRGTPLGAPVPTLKIASNTDLATRKANWIDFNAGRLLAEDPAAVTADLVALVAATAGGAPARNELNGYAEISLFKDGVIL